MNVGTKVRLNPEIFPEDRRSIPDFRYGRLNYLALMLDWEMEVINNFKHDHYGNMTTVKVLSIEDKPNIVMIQSDLIKQGE